MSESNQISLQTPKWQSVSEDIFQFPASFSQRALWVIHNIDPDNLAYHLSFAFRVRGNFQVDLFGAAINRVVAEHESLRAVFVDQDGEILQEVAAAVDLQVPLTDLPSSESLATATNAAVRRVMPLDKGPLFTAEVLQHDSEVVVLLRFHHIIVDQLSIATVVEDLSSAYNGLSRGEAVEFVQTEIDYVDYVVWQTEEITREKMAPRLATWTERIEPGAGCNGIPTDHPRPATQSFSGAAQFSTLPADLTSSIRQFARSQKTSVFNVLLSSFALLLNRYSRDEQLLIGVPFANRGEDDTLERVAGLFINTLPVPCNVLPDQNFEQTVQATSTVTRDIQGNQDVPLEFLMEALKPVRDPAFNPLFQIGFSVQQSDPTPSLDGLEVEIVPVHNGSSMYDLHLFCWDDQADTVNLQLWYDDALFNAATMESLLQRYASLISACILQPESPVSDHSIISADELEKLQNWNSATTQAQDVLDPLALMDLLDTSVTCNGVTLNGRELDEKSAVLAARLQAKGVKPGDLVGVLMERSCDMLAAMLAVWKAGAGYIPLDPRYPPEWRDYVLADAGVTTLLADQKLRASLNPEEHSIVVPDEEPDENLTNFNLPVSEPESIAYVIYTSGSTGQPKGVMVPRRAVANFLSAMAQQPGLSGADRFMAVTTTSFDISVLELFLPLVVGADLCIATTQEAAEPNRLKDLLLAQGTTAMQATPSTWRMLVNADWTPASGFKVLCGGEELQADLAAQLVQRSNAVWNMYGPTETTVWSTCCKLEPGAPASIGGPIANTQIHVLDEHLKPVPLGIVGDLYIAGLGVTLGYWGKAELTRAAFKENPFGSGLLYRTGDLARWSQSGDLQYLGRSDFQVKIRGHRIELGQIETTLAQLDNISQVVVNPVNVGPGDHRLVAYYIPTGTAPNATQLRKHLRKALPDYMIPNLFILVTEFPLTSNGKVNRRLLPKPALEQGVKQSAALNTQMECHVAEIWSRLIGTSEIGRDANFFDIGGHSLLAVAAASEIEKTTGTRLNLRVFVLENLAEIAAKIEPETASEEPSTDTNSAQSSGQGEQTGQGGWLKRLLK